MILLCNNLYNRLNRLCDLIVPPTRKRYSQTITASGTWSVPAGVKSIDYYLVGAGGGGGGSTTAPSHELTSGGGSGSWIYQENVPVNTLLTITIGTGGGISGYTGLKGGDSSIQFDGLSTFYTVTAPGGNGAVAGTPGTGGTKAYDNLWTSNGLSGIAGEGWNDRGGRGGGNDFLATSGGDGGLDSGYPGAPNTGTGGGGGRAAVGGIGGSGVCIIWWWA